MPPAAPPANASAGKAAITPQPDDGGGGGSAVGTVFTVLGVFGLLGVAAAGGLVFFRRRRAQQRPPPGAVGTSPVFGAPITSLPPLISTTAEGGADWTAAQGAATGVLDPSAT